MSTSSSIPFTPADAAWLHMEEPDNRMTIQAVIRFDGRLPIDRFRERLEKRLVPHERFRRRPVEPRRYPGLPRWELDPDFHLDRHLQPCLLQSPSEEALMGLTARWLSEPLEKDRPLWKFHLVDGMPGGTVLVARLHHCLGDGIALVRLLLGMADEGAAPAGGVRREAAHGRMEAYTPPEEAGLPGYAALTGRYLKACLSLARLAVMAPDPRTALKGDLGVPQVTAVSEAVEMASVREAAHRRGCTSNDLLLAAVAGALRLYLQGRGPVLDPPALRAVVPVDLRGDGPEPELGNRFGLVFLPLPVGEADPAARVAEVRRQMELLKGSPQAVAVFGLLSVAGMLPPGIERLLARYFGARASLVLTSLRGPSEPLHLAGVPMRDMMFWVPRSGRLGLGLSLLRYAGRVRLGVASDAGLVPDPARLAACFVEALEELRE